MPPSRKKRRRSPSPLFDDAPRSTRSIVTNERVSKLTRYEDAIDIELPDDDDDDDDSKTIIVVAGDETDVADVADVPAKRSNPTISLGMANTNPTIGRKTSSALATLAGHSSTKTRQSTLSFSKATTRSVTVSGQQGLKSKSAQSVRKLVKSSSSSRSITQKRDAATSIDDGLSDFDPIEDDSATELTESVSRTTSQQSFTINDESVSAHLDSQRGPTFRPSARPRSTAQGTLAFPSSPHGDPVDSQMFSKRAAPIATNRQVEEMWIEKYAPRDSASLALHKRKYDDVRRWLCDVFGGRSKQRALVLAGPAGTSKTAALNALSCEMNFDLIEWTNPPTPMVVEPGEGYSTFSGMFSDFLSKAQQFGSAASTTTHNEHPCEDVFDLRSSALNTRRNRIILLEDFPSILSTSHAARKYFLDSIEAYVCSDISTSPPIVFVISEIEGREDLNIGSDSSYSAQHILGRDLMAHPRVARIQFNPVNKTLMSRVLRDIATKEGLISGKKSSSNGFTKSTDMNRIIAELALLGDVRSSINALQWWASTGGTTIAMGRETYLAHFQAAGKVLYNKPEDVGQIPVEDAVIQAIPISSLLPTLFENYPGSCADTEELVFCSEALSDSDILLSSQVIPRRYGRQDASVVRGEGLLLDSGTAGAHVAIRGLMCGLRRPVVRQNLSIKDFVTGKKHDRKSKSSLTSSNGHAGYSICNPLGYQVFKRQQDVLTDVARYHESTKLSGDTGDRTMSVSETAVMYMQSTAFWEALIKKNDKLRRIGGQYNGLSMDVDDDDDDAETLRNRSSDQFSQINDAFLIGSISNLLLSDDDIEESLSD
ncbi:Rad17 cell cycle checkpoint protein-domain-containing protein [Lipomyces kononenkoae]